MATISYNDVINMISKCLSPCAQGCNGTIINGSITWNDYEVISDFLEKRGFRHVSFFPNDMFVSRVGKYYVYVIFNYEFDNLHVWVRAVGALCGGGGST